MKALLLTSLFAFSLRAADHAPLRKNEKPNEVCQALYNTARFDCRLEMGDEKETLKKYIQTSHTHHCADGVYAHPSESAFFQAIAWESARLKGKDLNSSDELLYLIDASIIRILRGGNLPFSRETSRDSTSYDTFRTQTRDSSFGNFAEILARAIDTQGKPLRLEEELPTLLTTLEFLPLFDLDPIHPLQNVCGFFLDRHRNYLFQPRFAATQLLLGLLFLNWQDGGIPLATRSVAKKLFDLDPSGRSFYIVREMIRHRVAGADEQQARIWIDEALGQDTMGPFVMTPGTIVSSNEKDGKVGLSIDAHCVLDRTDGALPLITASSKEALIEKERRYMKSDTHLSTVWVDDAYFDLASGRTRIEVKKPPRTFALGLTCYGRRFHFEWNGAGIPVNSSEYTDLLYAAAHLHRPMLRRTQSELLEYSNGEQFLPDKLAQSIAEFRLHYNELKASIPGGRVRVPEYLLVYSSWAKEPTLQRTQDFLPLVVTENIDHPLVSLAARKVPDARPYLVSALYSGDIKIQKNAAIALMHLPPLSKHLRRYVTQALRAATKGKQVGDDKLPAYLASLLTLEERKELLRDEIKEHPHDFTFFAHALNAWDENTVASLNFEKWPSFDYGEWLLQVGRSQPKLLVPVLEEHGRSNLTRFKDDALTLGLYYIPVPEITKHLIAAEKAIGHETHTGFMDLITVNAMKGDKDALEFMIDSYVKALDARNSKQLSEEDFRRFSLYRTNLPAMLLRTEKFKELEKVIATLKSAPDEEAIDLMALDPTALQKYYETYGSHSKASDSGFRALQKAESQNAVLSLLLLSNSGNESQLEAMVALSHLGPNAKRAIPTITSVFNSDQNSVQKIIAGLSLLSIDPESTRAKVIPKLRRMARLRPEELKNLKFDLVTDLLSGLSQTKDELNKKHVTEFLENFLSVNQWQPSDATNRFISALGPAYARQFNTYLSTSTHLRPFILEACKKDPKLRAALLPALIKRAEKDDRIYEILAIPEKSQ